MKVQSDQVCAAVKSTVSQEMWGEIIEKLVEFELHQEALSVGADSFDDDPSTRPSSSTRTRFDLGSLFTEGDETAVDVNAAFAVTSTVMHAPPVVSDELYRRFTRYRRYPCRARRLAPDLDAEQP